MTVLDAETRRQLVLLARSGRTRTAEFCADRPTDWCPGKVRNPNGILDTHFTDAAAWEFIASWLEDGHSVEILELRKPAGATGYVMKIDIEPDQPQVYVKLELGSRKVFGRSFHYSERKD